MLKENCRLKMQVYFGRKNGVQTMAEIVKINPRRCKVKVLEQRGNGRGSAAGSTWIVPYSSMRPRWVKCNRTPRKSYTQRSSATTLLVTTSKKRYSKLSLLVTSISLLKIYPAMVRQAGHILNTQRIGFIANLGDYSQHSDLT